MLKGAEFPPVPTPANLISLEVNRPDNTDLMMVQSMIARGLPIRIEAPATDDFGRDIPSYVDIHADSLEIKQLHFALRSTPEIFLLGRALHWNTRPKIFVRDHKVFGLAERTGEPLHVGGCAWDDTTKARVQALAHHKAAEVLRLFAQENKDEWLGTPAECEEWAQQHEEVAARLLPEGTEHLALEEIRGLIDEVVEREVSKMAPQ